MSKRILELRESHTLVSSWDVEHKKANGLCSKTAAENYEDPSSLVHSVIGVAETDDGIGHWKEGWVQGDGLAQNRMAAPTENVSTTFESDATHSSQISERGVLTSTCNGIVSLDSSIKEDNDDTEDLSFFFQNTEHQIATDEAKLEDVDSIMARAMNSLSTKEREQVYFDLHGISTPVVETPTLIQTSLHELNQILQQGPHNSPYQQAYIKNPDYVQNREFQLAFLRADRFDVKAAAKRLAHHFRVKFELFGEDLLCKDIEQSDLEPDDIRAVYECGGYDLPIRDSAGRLVSVRFAQTTDLPLKSTMRKYFYVGMVMAKDVDTQIHGVVGISYFVGQSFSLQMVAKRQKMAKHGASIIDAVPVRVEATHFCYDSVVWRTVLASHRLNISRPSGLRIREHFGSHKEVRFQLQTFGIPADSLPVSKTGEIQKNLIVERFKKLARLECHNRRLQSLQNELGERSNVILPNRVGTPSRYDVLLGRGKASYNHFANIRLRHSVEKYFFYYDKAGFFEKKNICENLVKQVKSLPCPGRFLKDDGLGWMEVDDSVAIKKVGGLFRTYRGIQNNAGLKGRKDDSKTLE